MPPLQHAVLSASSAHRWLECPPSAMLEKELPDETTVYAEEGSVAHEVAEYKVRWYLGERDIPLPSTGNFNAEEIDRYTDSYAYRKWKSSIMRQAVTRRHLSRW